MSTDAYAEFIPTGKEIWLSSWKCKRSFDKHWRNWPDRAGYTIEQAFGREYLDVCEFSRPVEVPCEPPPVLAWLLSKPGKEPFSTTDRSVVDVLLDAGYTVVELVTRGMNEKDPSGENPA